jgi:hypothetical protein
MSSVYLVMYTSLHPDPNPLRIVGDGYSSSSEYSYSQDYAEDYEEDDSFSDDKSAAEEDGDLWTVRALPLSLPYGRKGTPSTATQVSETEFLVILDSSLLTWE